MQVAGPDNKRQEEEDAINTDNTEYTKTNVVGSFESCVEVFKRGIKVFQAI